MYVSLRVKKRERQKTKKQGLVVVSNESNLLFETMLVDQIKSRRMLRPH